MHSLQALALMQEKRIASSGRDGCGSSAARPAPTDRARTAPRRRSQRSVSPAPPRRIFKVACSVMMPPALAVGAACLRQFERPSRSRTNLIDRPVRRRLPGNPRDAGRRAFRCARSPPRHGLRHQQHIAQVEPVDPPHVETCCVPCGRSPSSDCMRSICSSARLSLVAVRRAPTLSAWWLAATPPSRRC